MLRTARRPRAPTNVTASTRTTTSIALTWAPATDNVGVAGYGIYNAGQLVNTTAGTTGIVSGLTCGTNYTLAVDAFDATGNSSPKTTVMVSTLPCADTTPPTVTLTAPTNGSTMTAPSTRLPTPRTTSVSRVSSSSVTASRPEATRARRYAVPVDTTTIANGTHTFSARAYDSAGNVGNATNVTVDGVEHHHTAPIVAYADRLPRRGQHGCPLGHQPDRLHGTVEHHDAEHGDRRQDDRLHPDHAQNVTISNSKISCNGIDYYAVDVGRRAR